MSALKLAFCAGLAALLTGCEGELVEPDTGSLEEPELGWFSLHKGQGGVNGEGDYCNNPAALCVSGEGDCDYTYQCAAGLVCAVDNGGQFGFTELTDVCVVSACTNGVQDGNETGVDCGSVECGLTCGNPCDDANPNNGDANHCKSFCPCAAGHGDCDSDAECLPGLDCATDVGATYGFTPLTDVCEGGTCTNGIKDGDELGVDCGGSCSPCEVAAGWAKSLGNATANAVAEIAVDEVDGAVYVAGQFTGTLNSGVGNLVSAGSLDFFVVKYDFAGNPLWAKSYGGTAADGDGAIGLSVDPVTRRLAIGTNFQGTDDFGGGNLTSAGSYDAIVIVLDSAGNYVQAQRYGAAGTDRFEDVRWDRFGNLYLSASFTNTVAFGGAALVSAGGFDVAAVKLNSALAHIWSARFGGTGTDLATEIAVDRDGKPVLVGTYTGTATFGATQFTSAGLGDMFVLKLLGTTSGVSWVKSYGGLGADAIKGVAIDKNRNVYAVGGYKRSVDFGGGLVTAAGASDKLDGFVLALSSTGAFRWVRTMGSTDHDSLASVAVDVVSTDLAVGGNFKLTLTGFDESGADVVSAGGIDGIVWTIDSATGTTQAVTGYGTAGDDYAESVERDGATVEALGSFTNTMSVSGINVTSAGGTDAWIAHYPTF
jgi:hypothetical protein